MFGNLGAFVNGNMFAGAGPFGPAERPMGGYLSLPSSFTAEQATRWVNKAQAYVATLPPKHKKKSQSSRAATQCPSSGSRSAISGRPATSADLPTVVRGLGCTPVSARRANP